MGNRIEELMERNAMLEKKVTESESRALVAEAELAKIVMSCTENLDRMNKLREATTPRGTPISARESFDRFRLAITPTSSSPSKNRVGPKEPPRKITSPRKIAQIVIPPLDIPLRKDSVSSSVSIDVGKRKSVDSSDSGMDTIDEMSAFNW